MSRCLISASIAFAVMTTGPLMADEADWRSQILKLQSIERLMAASIKVRDREEMRNQVSVSDGIVDWLKRYPARNEIPACGMAIFGLSLFGSFMFGGDTAGNYLERAQYLKQFKASMPECEKRLGLSATAEPNLRSLAM